MAVRDRSVKHSVARWPLFCARSRYVRDSGEQRAKRLGVDVQNALTTRRRRQLEACLVEPLVEQAQSVSIEPQDLQARSHPSAEHEHRAAVDWIAAHALSRELRQPIEAQAHVDWLDAEEDADALRNHVVASSSASNPFSADDS